MKPNICKKILSDAQHMLVSDAKRNGWMWYFNLHIKDVFKSAEKLLALYKADEQIVYIAALLHDSSKFKTRVENNNKKLHATHHIDSAKVAEEFLNKYNIPTGDKDAIIKCVLNHRHLEPYLAETEEEKVIAVADVMSHFNGIFYFAHFKFNPNMTIDMLASEQKEYLERDWEKLELLPKAKKQVKDNYLFLKELFEEREKYEENSGNISQL